jgi:hypothetical protein
MVEREEERAKASLAPRTTTTAFSTMSHTHDHALHDCSASGHSHDLPPRTNAQLEADRAEKAATALVLASFYHYQSNTLAANQRRLKDVLSLKKEDQDLLAKLGYREKLKKVDELIVQNADLLREIADTVGHDMFGEDESDSEDEEGEEKEAPAAVARHPYDDDDDDDEGPQESFSLPCLCSSWPARSSTIL